MRPAHYFCSTTSREASEQRFGTATRADYWLALEYPEPFGRKAFDESNLPAPVKRHLTQALQARPNVRLQLIRKGSRFSGQGPAFFAAVNHEESPRLYEFHLSRYEDLLDLNIPGILAEERPFWKYERKEPLFLVCTNGKRDPCCARFGLDVFRAMRGLARENTWQTSHVGGHRFAANVVTLPHGVYYGSLTGEDASALVQALRAGAIHLPRYRGRSCYQDHVQAAEAFLRQRAGLFELERFKLIEIASLSEDEWTFHFSDVREAQTYCLQVRREPAPFEVLKSCGEEKPVRLTQFRLVDYAAYREMEKYPVPPGKPGAH